MRKVALHNLGCKVNSYETEAMRQALEENGYEIVAFSEKADVYIINTCTVTNMADRKSRQMLHKAKKLNKDAVVVAVGCYVQAAGEELQKDEAIDIIIGNNNKSDIVSILDAYYETEDNNMFIEDLSRQAQYDEMKMTTVGEHTRAFVKIQDGCNQFCTYCIIPYARGRIRSRSLEDLGEEIPKLAECGYKEIVLTGIHLSSYGKDFAKEESEGSARKLTLIDAIKEVAKVDGIKRIRLGSLEPGIITEEFLEELKSVDEFCPHFHLSLQSGCDDTLKRMNRHYSADEYYEKCQLIRKYYPQAAITTDVIVGFPGETEEEFKTTSEFLAKVAFSEMHIFKYSKRQGTKAAVMENQVREEIKTVRSDELIALGERLREEYIYTFLDKEAEVLIEEPMTIDGKVYMTGHTREYVKVVVDITEEYVGQIIPVVLKGRIKNEILLAKMKEMY